MDAVVDQYFPVLEGFGERIEALEDEVVQRPIRDPVTMLLFFWRRGWLEGNRERRPEGRPATLRSRPRSRP